jgi:SAM-dependent methyltransferase
VSSISDFVPSGRGPFACRFGEIRAGERVLNLGCFNGGLERHFLEGMQADYAGVDINEEAIQFAKAHAREPERFQVGQAEALPYADGTFDVVLCLDVLEHVQDEKKALSEIARALRPGGRLVLSVPNDFLNFLDPDELTRGLRNLVRTHVRKRPLLTHPKHRHYSLDALRSLMSGFRLEKIHRSGTPVFWVSAMFYNALGLPSWLLDPMRKLTNPVDNLEYAVGLPTGFNLMVLARKPGGHPIE